MATTRRIPVDVSEAINTISYRIEKTESDFLGHLQKVETKLEQIAELTRTVALLQQQTNQQTDQISEIRNQLRDQIQKHDHSVSRLHNRLDEMNTNIRDRFDINAKEDAFRVKAVEAKADNTEKELKQWLNRGAGAVAILTLLLGIVQTGFYRWIDNVDKQKTVLETTVQTLSSTVDKQSQQVSQLIDLSKENALLHKDIDRRLIELDKDVSQLKRPER
jgi:uncharacterized phage infection (PIP) family protein YhgE